MGSLGFFGLLLWHVYGTEPGTFGGVVVLSVLVLGLEVPYFERELLVETVHDAVYADSVASYQASRIRPPASTPKVSSPRP